MVWKYQEVEFTAFGATFFGLMKREDADKVLKELLQVMKKEGIIRS